MKWTIVKEILHGCKLLEGEIGKNSAYLAVITPEIAARWMQLHNSYNRPLNQNRVMRMVADLLAGRWSLVPDAIGFNDEGVLVSGQHRLAAIARSGVTQPFYVIVGLNKEAAIYTDNQQTRSAAQNAKFGYRLTELSDSQRKFYINIGKNMVHPDSRVRTQYSNSEWIQFVEDHRKSIGFSYESFYGLVKDGEGKVRARYNSEEKKGVAIAVIMAGIAMAYEMEIPEDSLRHFVHVLMTGEVDRERDRTITKGLRNWLMKTGVGDSTDAVVEARARMGQVLKAWLAGREVKFTKKGKVDFWPEYEIERVPLPEPIVEMAEV